MKLIFLDFDGVLATASSGNQLDPRKLELLELLLRATDARIVITSSWRKFTLTETAEMLDNLSDGISFPVSQLVGITPRMYSFCFTDTKHHYKVPRGVEIKFWLDRFTSPVENYVIIDDHENLLLEQAGHFVHTDTEVGLTEENVMQAINILNTPFNSTKQ